MSETEANTFHGIEGAEFFRKLFMGKLKPTSSGTKPTEAANLLTDEECERLLACELYHIHNEGTALEAMQPTDMESVDVLRNIIRRTVNGWLATYFLRSLVTAGRKPLRAILGEYMHLRDRTECYGRISAIYTYITASLGEEAGLAVLVGFAASRISLRNRLGGRNRLGVQLIREHSNPLQGLLVELQASVVHRAGAIAADPVSELDILARNAAKEVGDILSRDGDNRDVSHLSLQDEFSMISVDPFADWFARQEYLELLSCLTRRQALCLGLVALKRTVPEIAEETGLSPETVKWHIAEGRRRAGRKK